MTLTDEERTKFAGHLDAIVKASDVRLKEMNAEPTPDTKAVELLCQETAAYAFVADKVRTGP